MLTKFFSGSFIPAVVASLMLVACGSSGNDDPVVRLGGALDRPAELSAGALAERPAVTQTVAFLSGSGMQQRTYTGADLWSLLTDLGIQINPSARNDTLNRYVLATGADGYRVVFGLGELDPRLGNKGSILAYAETRDGVSGPIADEDGPFRGTAPGDVRGGRHVSQLVRLDVFPSGSTLAASGGGPSSGFTVSGAVGAPADFDLEALRALPATTVTVGPDQYTGVALWTLLDGLALTSDASIKNPLLSMYAVATGSDGYKAIVSIGEIHPSFGNARAVVAYQINGSPLDRNGMARLVMPDDQAGSRRVSNLIGIEVFAAPAAP